MDDKYHNYHNNKTSADIFRWQENETESIHKQCPTNHFILYLRHKYLHHKQQEDDNDKNNDSQTIKTIFFSR
jgi:hypothetical protein